MVETDFLRVWEQLQGNPVLLQLLLALEEVDGYVSDIVVHDLELEHKLLQVRIIEKNRVGGCYPGENFCAFLNQLDIYSD